MLTDLVHLLGQGTTVQQMQVSPGVTVTGPGATYQFRPRKSHNQFRPHGFLQSAAFQAIIMAPTVTSVSGTIRIEISQDGQNWLNYTPTPFTLSGTTGGSIVWEDPAGTGPTDGLTLQAPWYYIRANVLTLTGTGATAFLAMGVA